MSRLESVQNISIVAPTGKQHRNDDFNSGRNTLPIGDAVMDGIGWFDGCDLNASLLEHRLQAVRVRG